MKILMKRIICLLVWAFFFVCTIPPCASAIRTYYGVRDAEVVDGSNLSALKEGEIVRVMYDCAFSGYLVRPSVMRGDEQFQRLQVSGTDQCLLICLGSKANHELKTSGRFFLRTADAAEFVPERRYMLAGIVKKTEPRVLEDLKQSMMNGMFADPEGVDQVLTEYYIYHIDAETAKGTMLKRYAWTAFGAMGCFFYLLAFFGRLKKIRYGLVQPKETQKEEETSEPEE